ncbi:MAG: phage tail tape measure C-terminal domain-containing protein, partial [Rhodospirillaceae bacterium]
SNVKLLGAALDEPEQALENLERAGVRFTDGQRDLIQGLVDSGRQFEAQQAILDAVAESVGGADASAQQGLTGRVKGLTDAWGGFVDSFGRSESVIGQAAGGIIVAVTGVLNAIREVADQSVGAQIAKLETEQAVLEAQVQSNDFGAVSLSPWSETNAGAMKSQAVARLTDINRTLADLSISQRQADLAAAIAAEDQQGRLKTETARIVAAEIADINDGLDQKLNDLSATRIDKIREEADAQTRVIEGQKAQAQALGLDISQYDATILKVRQVEAAEIARAEATDRSTKATRDAIDPNQRYIESLQSELDLMGMVERERRVEQAVRRLSAEATAEQVQKARELSAALYDEKTAQDAATKAQQVMGQLRQQLANVNASAGDVAAAHAIKQLGDNASVANKELASLLARQLELARDGQRVYDSVKTGAQHYAEELERLNELLKAGAISHQTYELASTKAYNGMLASSKNWEDGVTRGWRKYSEAANDAATQAEKVFSTVMKGMEDVFVNFVTKGELNFSNMADSIIADLACIFFQRQIMGPIGDALFGPGDGSGGKGLFGDLFGGGGLFAAGAVFDAGQVTAFASGGIFDRPPLFPMATGMGLMGEAGPEAVMPLQRGPDGRLGVSSSGGGGSNLLQMTDATSTYIINVDARGSTDAEATAATVQRVIADTLGRLVPGIVNQASASAYGAVVDQLHRRGGKF